MSVVSQSTTISSTYKTWYSWNIVESSIKYYKLINVFNNFCHKIKILQKKTHKKKNEGKNTQLKVQHYITTR